MLREVARNWWLLVLRGACAILFGVFALAWPGVTVGALLLLFGAYAFADGVLAVVAALSGRASTPWGALLLEGLVGLGAAAAALFFPGVTAIVLLYLIAFWAILTGILEIAAALQLRKEIDGEFWLGLAGAASILFGVLLVLFPAQATLTLVWLIGSGAIVIGAFLILLGWRLRGVHELGKLDAAHDFTR